MPIISIMNSCKAILLGLLLSFFSSEAIANELSVCINDGRQLKLKLEEKTASAKLATESEALSIGIDNNLKRELLLADEIIGISESATHFENADQFSAIIRVPSRRDQGKNYCGAGHEDSLVLMELRGTTLYLVDKALIQSCLTNVTFASDQGDDPRLNVTPGPYPVIANFQSLSPPDFKVKRRQARVAGRKIVIVDIES